MNSRQQPPIHTYRDIFKWGDKREEPLTAEMKALMKEKFGLNEQELKPEHMRGENAVQDLPQPQLNQEQLDALREIAGEADVETSDISRAAHAYGKFYTDLLHLRMEEIPHPPDAVVYPRDEAVISAIVQFCRQHQLALTPFGASSSVTRGTETPHRGISLDMTRHFNQVIDLNTENQTVTAQPGVYGPELENYLNVRKYTCGHFPQSFEYATVGGWVAARGAGQASTGYGKIEDMVVSLRVITAKGTIVTNDYPRMAQGWNLNEPFIGSEGSLGVITAITLKVHRYKPANTQMQALLFKSFAEGVKAMREVMQGGFGKPHLFRISDPEETEIAFKTQGFEGTFKDRLLHLMGYKSGKRCLMFMTAEGEKEYAKLVKKKVTKTAIKHRALSIGKSPTKKWLKQRFESAYLRDPLMDAGLITDTLETAVTWENLYPLWQQVHAYLKSRPNTIAMSHISHVYENGANLYFTFISPADLENPMEDYRNYHKGLIDTIVTNHGSLSHHHGIGRTLTPWLHTQYNRASQELMRALKTHLDPEGIMNPGSVIPEKQPDKPADL